jgi:hypothetical protein
MKTIGLVALLCCLAPAGAAVAETLVVNDQVQVRNSGAERPARGSTMHAVEQRFGQPAQRHATVGGAPSQPPITRWDYPNFSVFFERDRVIHAVATSG